MHERKVRYLTGIYFYDTAGTVPVILQKNDVMSTRLQVLRQQISFLFHINIFDCYYCY